MFILFVDDDSDDTELYREAIQYLNKSEYLPSQESKLVCQTVNTGDGIIAFLRNLKSTPDLIFLDINMPIVSGKECLKLLKADKDFAGIPVIMLSTGCTPDEQGNFRRAGAAECIRKPTDFRRLIRIFSKFIFNQTAQRPNV